jgi:hypothetical protein
VDYSYSDFVGYLDTEKSTSGYIFTLVNRVISWKSSKQTITTSTMMYTKFVACYEATGQAKWFKKFVLRLIVVDSIEKSLKIYYDNESVVQYSYNKKGDAAKHINIKYYVVKKKIQDRTISLAHKYQTNACGSFYERLITQCVHRASSRHGFKAKHMILEY